MKTTLIIGSGVSCYSDIPNIQYITEYILTSNEIGRNSDSNYYINGYLGYSIQDYLNRYVIDSQLALNIIKEIIDRFYTFIKFEHKTNYEDIYYVVRQIYDSIILEYENPAVLGILQELINRGNFDEGNIESIMKESVRFIESIVWQLIDVSKIKSNQFDIVDDLIKHANLNTILNLNHDLVLEDWLSSKSILFDDGFQYDNKKVQEWKGFTNSPGLLKVCKVHGSIDWFDCRIEKPYTYDNIVKIPRNFYAEYIHDLDNAIMAPNSGRPYILIGTFNKMLGYLAGVYEILFDQLKSTILESEYIIISGYGFGDKGINARLTNWLFSSQARKMILVHPDRETLISNSRGSFKINIMNFSSKNPKVILLEKKFEDINYDDIAACF
jgi:hypothetical protein